MAPCRVVSPITLRHTVARVQLRNNVVSRPRPRAGDISNVAMSSSAAAVPIRSVEERSGQRIQQFCNPPDLLLWLLFGRFDGEG
jgi:hypothetical protein